MNLNSPTQHGFTQDAVDRLAAATGGSWLNIESAHARTQETLRRLKTELSELSNNDASIVVFGSLARGEETERSDVDWTLLVDGRADPKHLRMAQEIRGRIPRDKEPGGEGTFGNLTFSHQILHFIGGEDDTNANTTKRILLLLESRPIGNPSAWTNVRKNLLQRYLEEDHGLRSEKNERRVPLFLLNDIARYWRTMVVDYAYKQRDRANVGSALRGIKLGFSRKLIYASGLLACFACQLRFPDNALFRDPKFHPAIEWLDEAFSQRPLDLIADLLLPYPELHPSAGQLFTAYDKFLGVLADTEKRKWLQILPFEDIDSDESFQQVRAFRNEFGSAMLDIFLRIPSPIQRLMIERGVF